MPARCSTSSIIARRVAVALTLVVLTLTAGRAARTVPAAEAQIGSLQVSAGGPYSAQVGQAISLSAQVINASMLNSQAVQYQWSFGDGTTGFGQFITHSYQTAGTFGVTVTASSGAGQYGTVTTFAQVGGSNVNGQVSAGGPYSGQVGAPISFSASASSTLLQGGQALQLQRSFGDGSSGFGQVTSHTYAAA